MLLKSPWASKIGVLALMVTIQVAASQAQGEEQRCTELGSNCLCSEPMNSNDSVAPGWNPSDTPSSLSTECTDVAPSNIWFDTNKSTSVLRTEDAPDGTPALRLDSGGGGNIVWMYSPVAKSSARRACVRYYKWISPDYSGAAQQGAGCFSERNKVTQFEWQNSLSQVTENQPSGQPCGGPPYGPYGAMNVMCTGCGSNGLTKAFNQLSWDDCQNGWCRFEHCVSGNIRSGNVSRIEARFSSLSRDLTETQSLVGNFSLGPQTGLNGADLFHGQGTGPRGHEWISHFMYAEWTTDNQQWIGGAYEIDGGFVPPPPPAAPAPPVLLE